GRCGLARHVLDAAECVDIFHDTHCHLAVCEGASAEIEHAEHCHVEVVRRPEGLEHIARTISPEPSVRAKVHACQRCRARCELAAGDDLHQVSIVDATEVQLL